MNLISIVGLIIVSIISVVIVGSAFLYLDVMSYTATSSETLKPSETSLGHALVVYDPGITGSAKNAAVKIANDLQSKGYTVDLAGIRSSNARNVNSYNVIAVVGPVYWDKLGSAAQLYLQNIHSSPDVKVGVFATGIVAPESNDSQYMHNFVTNLPDDSPVKVKSVMKLVTDMSGNDVNKTPGNMEKQSNEFVSELIQ